MYCKCVDVDFVMIIRKKNKTNNKNSYYNNTDFDCNLFVLYVDRFR